MRTTHRSSSTTGVTRRAPVISTLAAVCMAVPLSGLLGGVALAAEEVVTTAPTSAALVADRGNSEAAKTAAAEKKDGLAPAVKTADNKPADFVGPVVPAAKAETKAAVVEAKAAPAPQPEVKAGRNSNTTSTPYTNTGGVTTGSNTTKYEVVNGRSGSPAVGGGKPSGNVMSPQPYSKADQNNTGANDTSATNPYRSTRDGAPSLNGNGGGKQVGQPCAGCVGKADNKNPPGQAPNATDRNAGYECDRNHGIGRSNPAHTGCTTTPTTTPQYDCKGHLLPNNHDASECTTPQYDCKGHLLPNNHDASECTTPKYDCKGHLLPNNHDASECKDDEEKKITICHATSSETNPFVVITISKNGLNGHEDHANDVIPPYTYKGVSYPGKNVGQPCGGTKDKLYDCKGHELPNNHSAAECETGKLYDCKGHELPNDHTAAECETGKTYDCKGHELPNDHTTAECTQDVLYDCKGHQLPNDHTAAECNPPVVTVCPAGTMQTPAGCTTTGNTDGGAQGPGTIRPNAPTITPIDGTPGGPAQGETAGPTALPFTGTDALLLAQLSALMLLVGGGLVGMSRKRKILASL